ncbi:PREDICTED: probable ATP-dependent RNA helicase DDX31 [Dinoponera quadriceps]|uniref:ATP-dependent RNA helicase n=1 Tax=Dinoponera quadriceps TaxID=609295 RepID=A0A6P3XEL3_DINQU|nr:PREDICTED: probable ATP-dependent RNA helicase DDX31 [Dinoponera quadriceps]XP_014476658.1 PREDICTED: probable ATP-dependent RNA helicase DDX31 [Dinoponera quadriceps]
MAIQDIDICLNVTAEPVVAAKKKKGQVAKTSVKRLKHQSLQKAVYNKESKRNMNVQKTGGKTRIKQKSLPAIFAKKLKDSTSVHNILQQSQISFQAKNTITEVRETEKIKQPDTKDKKTLKSDGISSALNSGATDEPIVSFTKTAKEYFGKTLLAKKRNMSENKQKKSLSDIFSSQFKNQTQLNISTIQKYDIDKNSIGNKEPEIVVIKKPSVSKDKKERIEQDKQKEKVRNKKIVKKHKEKIPNDDKELDKLLGLLHKPGGKISSLFGNNPDIPTIGQRLVKPVNEPIFTEITFESLNIHPFMISNLAQNMNITKMTTVQQKAIPQIFSVRDILIRSQTGSGKTLAYAIPIVESLHKITPKLNRNDGLSALIVVPTRELTLQTYECFIKLVKPFTWIVPGYLTGGEKRKAEKARLRKGCNILIATPGRLLDHIKHTKALKLHEVKYFILDEADRMLDMGYEKDISEIVSALKVSSVNKDESGYDPMKMLKQNVKKIYTDEDVEALVQENSKEENNKIVEDSGAQKQMYHSSDESDNDEATNYTVLVKKKKRNTKYSDMSKISVSGTESTREIEQDREESKSRRKTILLSATLTQAVEKLAGLTMRNPIFIDAAKENLEVSGGDISEVNEDLVVPQSVTQSYIVIPSKLRMVTLSAYIAGRCQAPGQHKILIFMATQDMVDYHTEILSSVLTKPINDDDEDSDPLVDVEFFKLYGNMTQKERTKVFSTFRQAESGVLLCTDVAARGLDMPKVDCVVQYTGPISARDYVHRIGRTARAGSSGTATIFLTPSEIEFVRMLESRRIRIKQEDMNDVLDKLVGPLSRHNSIQAAATALQNDFENLILENRQLSMKACKAYASWVRFYSSYPRDMREIFNRKELHLGHYAKSFALRDPPHRIGGMGKKLRDEESSTPKHNNRLSNKPSDGMSQKEPKGQHGKGQRTGLLKKVRMLNTSEYDSGLEPLKKPKK